MAARIGDDALGNLRIGNHGRGCTQLLRQIQRCQDFFAFCRRQALQARSFDIDCMPIGAQLTGQACRGSNHAFRACIGPDTGQQRRGSFPDGPNGLIDAISLNVALDPVGSAPQSQLPQCHQVALAEKMIHRTLCLVRDVHLPGLEPRQQFVRGDVDQHDFVGGVEYLIGYRLPDAHVGDAANHVVEALQVLNVQGAEDIDAGRQQFIHILPALGMAHARNIGMRQLVDQNQIRMAQQCSVQIEFTQRLAAINDCPRRQDLQALEQRGGFHPAMGLDHPDQHYAALARSLTRGDQHGVGLADPGRRAEINPQFAAPCLRLLLLHLCQQQVRIRTLVVRCRHRALLCAIQLQI